jgi:outer membrane protein OmpA-like peptidoglycan-associated protein
MESRPFGDPLAPSQQSHWIPLSDLMTGLMMMFLLISIVYMVKVEADSNKIKEVAVLYERMKTELYEDLRKEFEQDLPRWGAELQSDMTIRFKEPDVLFSIGKDDLKPKFKTILDDFFPRYARILTSSKYKDSIQEVRIEGHTSSIWSKFVDERSAYFLNMGLSQARTRSTLHYVFNIGSVSEELPWLRERLTANGLSSAKPIKNQDGTENYMRSQRVEFRVRTDSESRIAKIIESAK